MFSKDNLVVPPFAYRHLLTTPLLPWHRPNLKKQSKNEDKILLESSLEVQGFRQGTSEIRARVHVTDEDPINQNSYLERAR